MNIRETKTRLLELGIPAENLADEPWNLQGAFLRGADLEGANLYGADLRGANLEGANLAGARLYGAYLTATYLRKTRGIISFGPVPQSGRIGIANWFDGQVYFQLGCHYAPLAETVEAIRKKYGLASDYEKLVMTIDGLKYWQQFMEAE